MCLRKKIAQATQMIRIARERGARITWFDFTSKCVCHNEMDLGYKLEGYNIEAFHSPEEREDYTQMIRTWDFIKAIHDQGNAPLFDRSPMFWFIYQHETKFGCDANGWNGRIFHIMPVESAARKLNALRS